MKRSLSVIAALFCVLSAIAQNNYWKPVVSKDVTSLTKGKELFPGSFKPANYKLFTLNENIFAALLKQSPHESTTSAEKSGFTVSIPVADGSIEQFRITESPVMQPGLQAKHPEIRTYLGQAVNDPTSVMRFDFSPYGFHAIIISPKRSTVYINPITTAKGLYTVFDRSNMAQEQQVFDCNVDKVLGSQVQGTGKTETISDGRLRTYRFAVASGGEFSQRFLDGTETSDAQRKAKVLAGLVTDLIRTNVIFEADFGVHLNYVDNEDTIIFLNGSTDPFTSNARAYSTGKWNTESQQAIDTYIGTANYDVGHLLMGYPTGGNAGCIGCVCSAPKKGSGATGFTTDLTTDPFIVDFWDHEIGHQFGANHTFDYSYEGSGAQMEPGSGSTIMGYAGTTGTYDIQPHSDPYFHAISIQQVYNYITSGTGHVCAVLSSNHDAVPTAKAGADYTIPKSTPFVLTANSKDKDPDTLTYCWEQFNSFVNGTSSKFPSATATTGAVFRSLTPTVSKQRFFPVLSNILDGSNGNKWEVLPSVSRTMNFRLTVRDNHPGGGQTTSDDMVVTVDGNSGPFRVTTPDSIVTWRGGDSKKITWDVANTNLAPVNCQRVRILLSTDGGQTFNILLVDSAPNDGSVRITVPDTINTKKARIKVEAIGNIFFDISNADFKIRPSAGFAGADANAVASSIDNNVKVQPNPAKDFTTVTFSATSATCNLILSNANGKVVYNKTLNNIYKGLSEKISLAGLTQGVYYLNITTDKGTQTEKIIVQ
ncbi:MAG: zinc-dependent metalloprotease [Parafilimonas sp.]|nr:zinc-dependent metalloprotease [Parafilimonas sp.]